MSETKWTPGPWAAVRSIPAEGADVYWICAGEGNTGIEIGTAAGGYPHDRRFANACLIAAAPELYEALEEVVRISDRNNLAWEKAKAALAKARGE